MFEKEAEEIVNKSQRKDIGSQKSGIESIIPEKERTHLSAVLLLGKKLYFQRR